MGECKVFNFVESLFPLNVRNEVEDFFPAAFQFWGIPKIKKLLEENEPVSFWRKITEGN